jgi:uncharacterized membrane protein
MISEQIRSPTARIVIRPTRSLNWRETRLVASLLSGLTLAVGLSFSVRGMPFVLPFSGLEALGIFAAFYYVSRAGERQEVVTIERGRVLVQKGTRAPEFERALGLAWTAVDLTPSPLRLHPSRLWLRSHGAAVELGGFLTDGERRDLARRLIHLIEQKRVE